MAANAAQEDYWTSPAGLKWIEHEHALDTAMQGMLDVMLAASGATASSSILDIGCGTGASTLDAARLASAGKAVGVDISQPLLDRAIARADRAKVENASFLLADAQTHDFRKEECNVLISRIGMSFFSDSVAAFENLAMALNPGGRMAFVCWAAVDKNPWFHIPKKVAEARLGSIPGGPPHAPGPTGFSDLDHVSRLMAEAGLKDIDAQAVEVALTPPGGAAGAASAASRVGPAARIVKAHAGESSDEAAIEEGVRAAFQTFETDGAIQVPAVVNLFACHT